MSPKLILPVLAAGLFTFSGCDMVDVVGAEIGHFTRDFHYAYPLSARGVVNVETYNGSVEISGWDQDSVDISGVKYGPSQQAADDLKVEIDHQSTMVSIRVEKGFERRNRGAKFVIKIPKGARVDRIVSSNGGIRISDADGPATLQTSNGGIRVSGLKGELRIQTSNGGVELMDVEGEVVAHTSNSEVRVDRLRGTLEATTSNGPIHANLQRADHTVKLETSNGPIELSVPNDFRSDIRAGTSNNSITVRLPESINAHVSAGTSNSSISSDFELRAQGEFGKNHMDAAIGSGGGPILDLHTSNGPIRLLKQ